MSVEIEILRVTWFLQSARQSFDNAELSLVGYLAGESDFTKLQRACIGIEVATQNMGFCLDLLHRISDAEHKRLLDAASTIRPIAG